MWRWFGLILQGSSFQLGASEAPSLCRSGGKHALLLLLLRLQCDEKPSPSLMGAAGKS